MEKINKILILSHEDYHSPYGASSSLRSHCEIINQYSNNTILQIISNVYPRILIKGIFKKKECKNTKNQINYSSLPLIRVIDYCENDKLLDSIKDIMRKIVYLPLYFFSIIQVIRIVCMKKVDVIHLNSPVLVGILPLIIPILKIFNNKPLVITHMRDFLKSKLSTYQIVSMKLVDKFVAIDESTKASLLGLDIIDEKKVTIIANPFSSTSIKEMKLLDYEFKVDKIYCAVIGNIIEDKGFEFIIESFKSIENKDKILLIVGGGKGAYFSSVINTVQKSKNIEYLGEIDNLIQTNLYKSIDYVIRGDATYRTGRTVYEALYNQCRVIVPGIKSDLLNDEQLREFNEYVTIYSPRSHKDLRRKLSDLVKMRKNQGKIKNNHFKYYKEIVLVFNLCKDLNH